MVVTLVWVCSFTCFPLKSHAVTQTLGLNVLYRERWTLWPSLNGMLLQNKVFQPRAVNVRMKVVSKVSGSYCDLVLRANGHHRRVRVSRQVIRDSSILLDGKDKLGPFLLKWPQN